MSEKIVDKGTWAIEEGLVVLDNDHSLPERWLRVDRRHLPLSLTVKNAPSLAAGIKGYHLILVGDESDYEHCLKKAKHFPEFFFIYSLELNEKISAQQSPELKKELMKDSRSPAHPRE